MAVSGSFKWSDDDDDDDVIVIGVWKPEEDDISAKLGGDTTGTLEDASILHLDRKPKGARRMTSSLHSCWTSGRNTCPKPSLTHMSPPLTTGRRACTRCCQMARPSFRYFSSGQVKPFVRDVGNDQFLVLRRTDTGKEVTETQPDNTFRMLLDLCLSDYLATCTGKGSKSDFASYLSQHLYLGGPVSEFLRVTGYWEH